VLFPCTCVLQPHLVHLYQTSSLLPSPLPIVASASLTLIYILSYIENTGILICQTWTIQSHLYMYPKLSIATV
jgi:hypothetical protein